LGKKRMEASIIAALVTASGNLVGGLLGRGGRSASPDPTIDERAEKVAADFYDQLRTSITDSCFKAMLFLESGENERVSLILSAVYPESPKTQSDVVSLEFRYRLEYLRLLGLITLVGGSEYTISCLGAHFIEQARRRRDYYRVFYPR
jgi:hypothetical protein